jgi:hypothetical protein
LYFTHIQVNSRLALTCRNDPPYKRNESPTDIRLAWLGLCLANIVFN